MTLLPSHALPAHLRCAPHPYSALDSQNLRACSCALFSLAPLVKPDQVSLDGHPFSHLQGTHPLHHVFKCNAKKVAGTLNHISFVFPFVHSFLSPLYQWITEFPDKHKPQFMRPSVISNLTWWLSLLSSPQPPHSVALPPPPLDLQIWVDVSSDFGIGILFDSSWAASHLIPDWCGPSCDIGWLESLAIELAAILIISQGAHYSHFLIRSDNEGTIASFWKGRSRNFMSNLCIHCMALITHEALVSLDFLYVPSAENLVDPISWGSFPSLTLALPNPPTLPSSVTPFFLHGCSISHWRSFGRHQRVGSCSFLSFSPQHPFQDLHCIFHSPSSHQTTSSPMPGFYHLPFHPSSSCHCQ